MQSELDLHLLKWQKQRIKQLEKKIKAVKRIANERTIEGSKAMLNLAKIREIVKDV